ncbi:MAG: hypothetical protein Q8N51_14620 [Gammaproteobacteria bacterium]|nr:hypothetical protein [Gammaproteobacteria bacterium]
MKVLAALLAFLTLSGCIPYPLQETGHIYGRVTDAATSEPVPTARLHYKEFEPVVRAGNDGSYDFPTISKWQLVLLLPVDRFGESTLLIEADGYSPQSRGIPVGYAQGEPHQLDIQLHRAGER